MLQDERRKKMGTASVILFVLILMVLLLYFDNQRPVFKVLAILIGTLGYHVFVRLCISWFVAFLPEEFFKWRSVFYYTNLGGDEGEEFFRYKLRVDDWERVLPNYLHEDFMPNDDHSNLETILFIMFEDELIHLLNAIFSVLSVILGPILIHGWGWFVLFLLLGLGIALFEIAFIISQRYGRWYLIKRYQLK